jgi:hypothetical protein
MREPDKSLTNQRWENWPNMQVIGFMVVAEGLEPPTSRM